MLEPFGVHPEDEALFNAVQAEPGRPLPEYAASLALDTARVQQGLKALTERGLVSDGPAGLMALSHDDAVATLLAAREGGAAVHAVNDPQYIETIHDPREVTARIGQELRRAKRLVWVIHPGAALEDAIIDRFRPDLRDLAARGVDFRFLINPASRGEDRWHNFLREIVDMGHNTRMHEYADQVALVFDRTTTIVPTTVAAREEFGAHVLHGAALTSPAAALFDELWAGGGYPLADDSPSGDPDVPGMTEPRMKFVLMLQAQGMKDEAIARRLGVSIRTMRRIMAATMDALDAQNRFQAGAEAERRGWLVKEPRV